MMASTGTLLKQIFRMAEVVLPYHCRRMVPMMLSQYVRVNMRQSLVLLTPLKIEYGQLTAQTDGKERVPTCDREPPTSMIRHSAPLSRPASISKRYSETPTVFNRALRTSSAENR